MSRNTKRKVFQSMPDSLTIVDGTRKGNFSAFMIPSSSVPTVTEFIVNGEDISSNINIFPQDNIIPCNVEKVVVSTGNVILFS